ncbi:hypothetical protein GQR58_027847 [Nymphon striatum]|nr:hypothetical protein GQR58_027847 [Nymphon striatum]
MKGVRDQKIVVFSSDSQAAIQAIEGNIIKGWEEEEIIDKKDSAEGKTPNLPYRNSVFMGVFINFTSCQLDVAFPYVRTGLAIHFLFQTLHDNCFTHPKVTSQTSHSVFVQLGKMMGVNGC